jgi:hypothetical protein
MTAVAGLFGIASCLLLPGILILHAIKPHVHILGGFVLACAISMAVNHLLILLLVSFSIYRPGVVMGLAAVQLVAVIFLAMRNNYRASVRQSKIIEKLHRTETIKDIAYFIIVSVAIITYARRAFGDFGEIFSSWDAVVAFNRWAVDWAAGQIPHFMYTYPQMVPSLWSMIYLIIGTTELQVFAKAMMAWLPLLILLAFADMVIEDGRLTGVIGAIAAATLLSNIGPWAMSGYADVPASIMAFVAFYAAWLSGRRDGDAAERLALIGSVIAAGAMLTKQTGGFFALCYPVFLWWVSPKGSGPRIWRAGLLVVLVAAPWYIYQTTTLIFSGEDNGIVAFTQEIHGSRSYIERIIFGLNLIRNELLVGTTIYWIIGLSAAALLSSLGRILVLIVLSYVVLYCLFLSYDVRNSFPILSFLAWTTGLGGDNLLALVRFRGLHLHSRRVVASLKYPTKGVMATAAAFMVAICTAMFAWTTGWPDRDFLVADQSLRLHRIGDETINRAIVELVTTERPSGLILTDYQFLGFLPETAPHYKSCFFRSLSEFETAIRTQPIDFVLNVYESSPEVRREIDQLVADGRLTARLTGPNWRLLQLRRLEP